MLLRRVIEHVKAQNWTAVALDFVIVVVGVFIGIQVANWNEARADRSLGEDYTVRLVADLENDLTAARTLTSYYNVVTQNIKMTDNLLSSPDPGPKALVVAAYRASEFSSNPSNRATWDQVVSSGHLGLLPAAAIESGLPDYYRFQDSNDDTIARLQDTPYRRKVRSLIPLAVQISMREGCSDEMDDNQVIVGFVTNCNLDVDASTINETARELIASAELRELLRYQYSMVASVQINNTGNVALLEKILNALNAEDTD
ncbi:hypothetical protein PUV54_03140 [Hyphococcus flavus]|uniref:Uncharacterized protein n=1 Tax=Hyphococcus flavus TaxID=1866326 RepID=A0AAF0CF55_9PROT|nr:hypothetical protein [Hyphococcus flavus]WDI32186.1 hypothetical protein PUV54_03140 [Hyphococcus flavus]